MLLNVEPVHVNGHPEESEIFGTATTLFSMPNAVTRTSGAFRVARTLGRAQPARAVECAPLSARASTPLRASDARSPKGEHDRHDRATTRGEHPSNNTPEASQRYAEACAADWDAGRAVRFGVRDRATRALVGVVGLDSCVHLHRSCELGYWLRLDATGRGLMTESAKACVDFALTRLGVHRIRCAAATDNYPSLRVIARLGFRFEGISRQAEYVGGRWVDHAVFGRLATD
jgi:RimJ/RimL family protein N-acetyltransferase